MQLIDGVCQKHCPLVFLAGLLLVKEYATYPVHVCKVSHWMRDIGDKPENDPLNNNYIYIFRNIKTPNYVLFLFCVCLIYQS